MRAKKMYAIVSSFSWECDGKFFQGNIFDIFPRANIDEYCISSKVKLVKCFFRNGEKEQIMFARVREWRTPVWEGHLKQPRWPPIVHVHTYPPTRQRRILYLSCTTRALLARAKKIWATFVTFVLRMTWTKTAITLHGSKIVTLV